MCWTSLVVQWLRLPTPNAGGLSSIPSQVTKTHMSQLKILHDADKTHGAAKLRKKKFRTGKGHRQEVRRQPTGLEKIVANHFSFYTCI